MTTAKHHRRLPTEAKTLGRGVVLLLAALLLAAFILVTPGDVRAHAGYESSTPGDGEVVAEPPERVDIFFSQEIARSGGLPTVIVVNEAGDTIADEAVLDDADRTHISIELPPALPERRYTVIWHTLSDEDGEEARGAFHFFIGAGPPPQPTGGAESPRPGAEPTPVPTPVPTEERDDDGSGIETWMLIAGVAGGLVVGGGAGLLLGRRRTT
jgi:methionine-rich copper-binding protein CopC